MRKNKLIVIGVLIALCVSLVIFPVSAASAGSDTLDGVTGGKNALMSPEYITGGAGFNDAEGSASLFDYDEDSDLPKYCTDQLPYFAEWKYDKAYIVDRIIIRTANDNEQYPRRMGDGWTLSGSNDGSTWTVIYTGKADDVENMNFMYYYVDLPNNTTAYQYYKLNADESAGEDGNKIQISMFILCGNEPAAAVPVVETKDEPVVDVPVVEETQPAAVSQPAATTSAPATGDATVLFIILAVSALAAGVVVLKVKKDRA